MGERGKVYLFVLMFNARLNASNGSNAQQNNVL